MGKEVSIRVACKCLHILSAIFVVHQWVHSQDVYANAAMLSDLQKAPLHKMV